MDKRQETKDKRQKTKEQINPPKENKDPQGDLQRRTKTHRGREYRRQ
jgi:hypothetical protein